MTTPTTPAKSTFRRVAELLADAQADARATLAELGRPLPAPRKPDPAQVALEARLRKLEAAAGITPPTKVDDQP